MTEPKEYYNVPEVCEILHKCDRTIYAYIKSGQLKAYQPTRRAYLIAKSDLDDFIKNGVQRGYYQELYPRPHKKIPKE